MRNATAKRLRRAAYGDSSKRDTAWKWARWVKDGKVQSVRREASDTRQQYQASKLLFSDVSTPKPRSKTSGQIAAARRRNRNRASKRLKTRSVVRHEDR